MNDRRIEEVEHAMQSRLKALFEGNRPPGDIVISFSHFLPRIELIPEKRYLYFPCLSKFVGSRSLGSRIEKLRPTIHVFGHTHFGWDQELDGVRYISPPVGMPRERDQRVSTISVGEFLEATENIKKALQPVLLWSAVSGYPAQYDAGWSGFYHRYAREPHQVCILPNYVADNYSWDESKYGPKSQVTGWDGKTPAWKFGPAWARDRKRHY